MGEVVNINGIQLGKTQPAEGRQQSSRKAFPESVAAAGQGHEHGREQGRLNHQQHQEPGVQQLKQHGRPGGIAIEQPQKGVAENMQRQCQDQHHQKAKHIHGADGPGMEIAPVLLIAIDGVQTPADAVDAPSG